MTREEKFQKAHQMFDAYVDSKVNEVLDKIKAEIEEVQTYDGIYIDRAYVLEIIDKHKGESEE